MKKSFKYKVITGLTLFALLPSCSNEEEVKELPEENIVSTISVECVDLLGAKAVRAETESGYPGDVDPIINNSFNENSILYISQMGSSETTNPNFTDYSEDATSYCYRYQYYENDEANWDYNYNFKTIRDANPIDWQVVKSLGSVGNSFSFFSFYFPVTNTVSFAVKDNQAGPDNDIYNTDNFSQSDIMGAYHSTPSLYSRMRFRLFHLMVYLKITLYVPDYQNIEYDGNYNYSGFDKDAFVGAYVLNASTGFNIEWRANRSSDTDPPLTQPTSAKSNISMYRHPSGDDEIFELDDLKQYYPTSKIDTDKVRAYNFSVLVPGQTFNGNFLCFVFKDTENHYRYYYFNSNQLVGATGDFALTQGTLQQLYLYLPRMTNETILIGANILPWSSGVTDMTVTKEDKETLDDNLTD